ncbi:unnamed protein product, partial [Ectocarpus sp. 12 AP-2014]
MDGSGQFLRVRLDALHGSFHGGRHYCGYGSDYRVGYQPSPHQAPTPAEIPRIGVVPHRVGGTDTRGATGFRPSDAHRGVRMVLVCGEQFPGVIGPCDHAFGFQLRRN